MASAISQMLSNGYRIAAALIDAAFRFAGKAGT
jgi:hypothetical protein